MKLNQTNDGKTTILPETLEENAACDYLINHLPMFAGGELSIVRAFLAGVDWCIKQTVEDLPDSDS